MWCLTAYYPPHRHGIIECSNGDKAVQYWLEDSTIDVLVRELTIREFIRVFIAYKSKKGAGR